jgi:hypothetical protein
MPSMFVKRQNASRIAAIKKQNILNIAAAIRNRRDSMVAAINNQLALRVEAINNQEALRGGDINAKLIYKKQNNSIKGEYVPVKAESKEPKIILRKNN